MACNGSETDRRQPTQHHHSAGIVLMGEEVLQMDLPSAITSRATFLVVNSPREATASMYARLVRACSNLRYLDIAVGRLSDPVSCIPRALPRLSHLSLFSQRAVSANQLSGLLRLVPNVESISSLPATSPLAADNDLGPMGQRLIQRLSLDPTQDSKVLLRSLIVHSWNVRALFLSVTPPILLVLSQAALGAGALSATRELALYISSNCTDETGPLCALLAACRLRRLAVRTRATKAGALLSAGHTTLGGLSTLSLSFVNVGPVNAVRDAARVLAGAMPRALRVLRVSALPLYTRDLDALRALCRGRRIAYQDIDAKWWDM